MIEIARTGEGHGDEAGERRGLQIAAGAGLQCLEHRPHTFPGERPEPAERIPPRRRCFLKTDVPDGDERRQGITHHRQPDGSEPCPRQRSEFKRQRDDVSPWFLAERAAKRAEHQNGHAEGFVLAVAGDDGLRDVFGIECAGAGDDPRLSRR